jgi:K+-sensing histidine kinase KdpD
MSHPFRSSDPDDRRIASMIALAGAVAVPIGVAAALVPARDHVPNSTVALILAAVVAILATTGTRLTAAVAAATAGLGFDLFHTKPYGSLSISRGQDVQTTALLMAVGLIVGQLAARNRRHRYLLGEASYHLGRIHGVAEMVAAGEPTDQVVLAVANEIRDLLGLRSCRFDPAFAEHPGPFIERDGAVSWGAIRWGFGTMGLPSKEITLAVEHQGHPLGRFVLLAEPGTRVIPDQLIVAVALADQAGAALASRRLPA